MGSGLRERKRAKTAEAIVDEGLRLFRAKGYAATTVDDIAEAAEVSRATVFRYYPAKEDILFAGDVSDGEELRRLAEAQGPSGGEGFEDRVRSTLLAFAAHLAGDGDRVRLRWDIVSSDPRLLGRAFTVYARWSDDLVEVLGEDGPFAHQVVATASIAALYEAVRRWHARGGDLVADVAEALDALGLGGASSSG
jgi:AcrR family transcriptional regulator